MTSLTVFLLGMATGAFGVYVFAWFLSRIVFKP